MRFSRAMGLSWLLIVALGACKQTSSETTREPASSQELPSAPGGEMALSAASLTPYPSYPFLICNGVTCDAGSYRNHDSQLWLTTFDSTTGSPMIRQTFRLRIFEASGTNTIYEDYYVSQDSPKPGRVVTGKIAYARGLPFSLCASSAVPFFDGRNLNVINYDSTTCYRSTLNRWGKDTVDQNVQVKRASVTKVDLAEVVRTGSYCPALPEVKTTETYPIRLPGLLDQLGYCRNLDTQVFASVVDATTGTQIDGATIEMTFGSGATSIKRSYSSENRNAAINVTSDKITRVRGQSVKVCVSAVNYISKCVNTTAPAGSKDVIFANANAIKLIANKYPVGLIVPAGTSNNKGEWTAGTTFNGAVFDTDHTKPINVRVFVDGSKKLEFVADQANDIACNRMNVCDLGRNVGFSVTWDSLGIPPGSHIVIFEALNLPNASQAPNEQQWTVIDTQGVYVEPPSFGSMTLGSAGPRNLVINIQRADTSRAETVVFSACTATSTCVPTNVTFTAGQSSASANFVGLTPLTPYTIEAKLEDRLLSPLSVTTSAQPDWELLFSSSSSLQVNLTVNRLVASTAATVQIRYLAAPNAKGQRLQKSASVKFPVLIKSQTVKILGLRPQTPYSFNLVVGGVTKQTVNVTTP